MNKIIYRTNHFKKVLKRLWKIFVDVFQYRVHCKICNIVRANAPSMVYIFSSSQVRFQTTCVFSKTLKAFFVSASEKQDRKKGHIVIYSLIFRYRVSRWNLILFCAQNFAPAIFFASPSNILNDVCDHVFVSAARKSLAHKIVHPAMFLFRHKQIKVLNEVFQKTSV